MSVKTLAFLTSNLCSSSDSCILWPFSVDRYGYGRIEHRGERTAHRVMYAIAFGEIKDGLHVMHKCDTPSCVNKMHLSLGTHKDNMRDMHSKGRCPIRSIDNSGELHPRAKLKEVDVIAIRGNYAAGAYSYSDLAELYNVSRRTISDIARRVTWRKVA